MMNQTARIENLRFIRCSVQDESYGLDMFWVRSIQRVDQFKPDAGENGRAGWLSSREGDIPVYDLAARLGQPTRTINAQGRIVILNPLSTATSRTNRPWGLLVDRVFQVIQASSDKLMPMPAVAHSLSNYFRGVVRFDQELVLFLALERLHPDAPAPVEPPLPPVRRVMATNVKPKTRREKQILLFSTAEPTTGERPLAFALSITHVPEILNLVPLTRIPGAPEFVLGLVNWRSCPVPVIDLNARLGLLPAETSRNGHTRLLIVRAPNDAGVDTFAGVMIRRTSAPYVCQWRPSRARLVFPSISEW